MIGLENLERASQRRGVCYHIRQKVDIFTFISILASSAALVSFIMLASYYLLSLPPVYTTTVPFEETVAELKTYYQRVNADITHHVQTEYPQQKDNIPTFQRALQHEHDRKYNKGTAFTLFSSVLLSSIYTPAPMFTPQPDYLLSLPLSPAIQCNPMIMSSDTSKSSPKGSASIAAKIATESDNVCMKCADLLAFELFNQKNNITTPYTSLITPKLCETTQYLSIYTCNGSDTDTDDQGKDQSVLTRIIPCMAVYVSGQHQFFIFYILSLIVMLVSMLVVRKRLDIAQSKVMNKISSSAR